MATDTKRDQPIRLPNPSAQPFVAALKQARFFAVVFLWIVMLCLLAHVAAFVLAEWVGVYDIPEGAAAETEAAQPADEEPAADDTEPADEEAAADEGGEATGTVIADGDGPTLAERAEAAREWRQMTVRLVGPLRALGPIATVLLWVTLFVYLQIALLGRVSGIRQITSAVFLVLVFLATAVPWSEAFGWVSIGSFFDFGALLEARAAVAEAGLTQAAMYYLRYLVMPLVSLVVLVAGWIQFARGYGESVVANE